MVLATAILAVIHVIFGMMFLGAVFVLNLALSPVVLRLSPTTTKEFFTKFWPSMARFLHAAIGGTALFGLLLYASGGFNALSGSPAIYLDVGIVLAILAIVEGEALQIPAVNRLIKTFDQPGMAGSAEQTSFTPEQLKVFDRVKVGGIAGVLTITLSVVFMVAAAWA